MTGLFTPKEAAAELRISTKTLLEYVRAGAITYVLTGARRKFAQADLDRYVENQRRRECPSTGATTRRSGTTISSIKVVDFTARRRKPTKAPPAP